MSFDIYRGRVCGAALLCIAIAGCGGSNNSVTTPITATPTFSVPGGPYTTAQSVTISDTTSGAVIYYTLDGTTPTTASATYSAAIPVNSSEDILAIAVAPSHSASAINGEAYTLGTYPQAAGIWEGTDSSNDTVLAFITPNGQSVFIRSGTNNNDLIFSGGTPTVTSTSYNVSLVGADNFPYTLGDGTTNGTGSFAGTLAEQDTLTGALTFSSTLPTAYNSTWDLSFSTLTLNGSSLAAPIGTYNDEDSPADPSTGATITIAAAAGAGNPDILSSTAGTTSGCVLAGTVTPADPTMDLYNVTFGYSSCTGTWLDLNGVTFTGIAVLNTSVSPAQFLLASTGSISGTPAGLIVGFNYTGT